MLYNSLNILPKQICIAKFRDNEKKRPEKTQTLRAGGAKKIRPTADPLNFPGAWHGQNLISWRWSLLLPTNPVW